MLLPSPLFLLSLIAGELERESMQALVLAGGKTEINSGADRLVLS